MGQIVYWEDVREADELPVLAKNASTQQLVQWAGSSLDFYQIHYDKEFALANGLPGLIIHGALKNAWLAQLVTDWIGVEGTLRKLKVQYRGMDVPDDALLCKGTVTKKYVENDQHLVDCEIWLENSKGEKTTPGSATVLLPTRGA
jgi:acyl dehydratase